MKINLDIKFISSIFALQKKNNSYGNNQGKNFKRKKLGW